MTEQQIAAVKQALELIEPIAHNSTDDPRGKAEEAITALRHILREDALDKMAENARELGLDYEPVEQQPAAWVGLMEQEIDAICASLGMAQLSPGEVARAIEAKLKEKNT